MEKLYKETWQRYRLNVYVIRSPLSITGFSSSWEIVGKDKNRQEKWDPAKDIDSLQHESPLEHRIASSHTLYVLKHDGWELNK